MARWWKQAMTFGAEGRVERAWQDHETVIEQARALARHVEARRSRVNKVLLQVVSAKSASLPFLVRVREIAKNLGVRERELLPEVSEEATPAIALARIDNTLTTASTAMTAAKGLSAGVSSAAGLWALATMKGAASTGAALTGLSGAAATNATLAYLGGGTLASGGFGMAGGSLVLGGVVTLPVLGLVAGLAHVRANRQIAELTRESAQVESLIDEMKKLELVLDIAEKRAEELIEVIAKSLDAFEHELDRVRRQLFPLGGISRGWRSTRRFLGGTYFSTREVETVSHLLQTASEFARLLDQKVFDIDGRVMEAS